MPKRNFGKEVSTDKMSVKTRAGKYPFAWAIGRCYPWGLLVSAGFVGGSHERGLRSVAHARRTQPGEVWGCDYEQGCDLLKHRVNLRAVSVGECRDRGFFKVERNSDIFECAINEPSLIIYHAPPHTLTVHSSAQIHLQLQVQGMARILVMPLLHVCMHPFLLFLLCAILLSPLFAWSWGLNSFPYGAPSLITATVAHLSWQSFSAAPSV